MPDILTGGKGFDLEEALRAYFWHAGYFVIRGIPYRLDGEDITDVDLWLYERPTAATRRRLLVDIKNRKSPKASERVIWATGLRTALSVDGAIVATTDKRSSTRKLAKLLGVTLLDGDAVSKLTESKQLRLGSQLRSEAITKLVKTVDEERRATDWRQNVYETKAALLSGIGAPSLNRSLRSNRFFAEQTIQTQPMSSAAQTALRMVYHTGAIAAISLDYLLAEYSFKSQDERRNAIENSVRFGDADPGISLQAVRAAFNLARKYVENGIAAAKQIEHGFYEDARDIPAEIIAEYIARSSAQSTLFAVARELEWQSSAVHLIGYDMLTIEAKSLLGVFLDFNGVSREQIASAVRLVPTKEAGSSDSGATHANLFNAIDSLAASKGNRTPSKTDDSD